MKNAIITACSNYLDKISEGNKLIEVKLHREDGYTAMYDLESMSELIGLGSHLGANDSIALTFAHKNWVLTNGVKGDILIKPVDTMSFYDKCFKEFETNQCFRYWKIRHDVATLLGLETMPLTFHKAFNATFDSMAAVWEEL